MDKQLVSYFQHNPHIFVEDFLGIRLLPYQKTMLKLMNFKDKTWNKVNFGRFNGRTFYRKLQTLYWLMDMEENKTIKVYKDCEYIDMTRDELIEELFNSLTLY